MPVKCPVLGCDNTVTSVSFKSHLSECHKNIILSSATCHVCDKIYNTPASLYTHLKRYHGSDFNVEVFVEPSTSSENIFPVVLNKRSRENFNEYDDCKTKKNCINHHDQSPIFSFINDLNECLTYTIDDSMKNFVQYLYGHGKLSRKLSLDIIEKVGSLTSTILNVAIQTDDPSCCQEKLKLVATMTENIFSKYDSDYKVMKEINKSDGFVAPSTKIVDAILVPKQKGVSRTLGSKYVTLQVIPIREVLKRFLSAANVYEKIVTYIEKCDSTGKIVSPMQGTVWRNIKAKFDNKIVFPLALYFDNFEINNPLSTHRGIHKMGAVYISLLCIPNEYRSVVSNIFLTQIHNSKDHASYGNLRIFSEIIEQLKDLEESGISIEVEGKKIRVYFVLLSVLGDNLGLNTLLGFVTSFSANYCCRFCLANSADRKVLEKVDEKLLRTDEKYSCSPDQGIKENCIFNELKYYRVIILH